MKLKKIVVSVVLLTLMLSVFLSLGVSAMAEDAPVPEAAALSYVQETSAEETAADHVGLYVVAGCTVLLAVCGVLSVNCQKIYDSEK